MFAKIISAQTVGAKYVAEYATIMWTTMTVRLRLQGK
jgi:hypothetical protein